jgi:pyridoxine 4-dehydrogenase
MITLNKYGWSSIHASPDNGTNLYGLLVKSGKIGSIGLSECSEATLTRASKVFIHFRRLYAGTTTLNCWSKVGKVAAVEIEVSFWTYEDETRKGDYRYPNVACKYIHLTHIPVIATAHKLGAVVAAYSPLGRGFLTGKLNPGELSKQDHRSHIPRLQGEVGLNPLDSWFIDTRFN